MSDESTRLAPQDAGERPSGIPMQVAPADAHLNNLSVLAGEIADLTIASHEPTGQGVPISLQDFASGLHTQMIKLLLGDPEDALPPSQGEGA